VGLPRAEAERVLMAAGIPYEIRVTTPRRFGPGRPEFAPELRVIQQRPSATGVLLIAARPLAAPADEAAA
jgi:hypothetical protein